MAKKIKPIVDDDIEFKKQWDGMNNAQRAAYLGNQYDVLTRNDREIAKQLELKGIEIERLKVDYESYQNWADYERFIFSVIDRDLVADAKAVNLFDNDKDPRDRSGEPEPPDDLKDQCALLWPFK